MEGRHSAKNLHYNDRYSKNPILNNLIKVKLESQMQAVKSNFSQILKKQTQTVKPAFRKVRSYSINPKKIQDDLSYNPIHRLNHMTENFIASRQVESFLHTETDLAKINQAREEHGGLQTKLNEADKLEIKRKEDLGSLQKRVKSKSVKDFSQDIWLPEKPEILYMIEDKHEQIKQKAQDNPKSNLLDQEVMQESQRFTNNLLGSSRKSINEFPLISPYTSIKRRPTEYTPQRYNKDDYKNLENWFEDSVEQCSKSNKETLVKLNEVYGIYLCSWKQIIRLTYIESGEKGLLLEKLFFSMLRLFNGMIESQQDVFRSWKRESMQDSGSLTKMMQLRMEELNKRYESECMKMEQLREKNHKLGLGFVAYEKVNGELMEEVEKITAEKQKLEQQTTSIGAAFLKTLTILEEKQLVKVDYSTEESRNKKGVITSTYRTYYTLSKQNKPVVLGRFKSDEQASSSVTELADKKQKFKYVEKSQELSEQKPSAELKQYNERYGHNIRELSNELNRFWGKKENDLEMKGIISSCLFNIRVEDKGTGTVEFETRERAMQFPEDGMNFTQQLLDELRNELTAKFQIEKDALSLQVSHEKALLQKWKNSFHQLQEKNKHYQDLLHKESENNKQIKGSLNEMKEEIFCLLKEKEVNLKEMEGQAQEILELKNLEEQRKLESQLQQKQVVEMKKLVETEKDNNKMLVRGNLEMKEKVEKYEIKYTSLLKNVKNAAPWLEKLVNHIERPAQENDGLPLDLRLLKQISKKIEEHLGDFVERDSSLFMTKLT